MKVYLLKGFYIIGIYAKRKDAEIDRKKYIKKLKKDNINNSFYWPNIYKMEVK